MTNRPFIPTDTQDSVRHLAGDTQVAQRNRDNAEITDTVGVADGQSQMYTENGIAVTKIFDEGSQKWLPSYVMGHGQIYVAASDAGDVTISDSTNYFEATAMTWTLSSGLHLFDESDGNGRLTYTGTVAMTAHIALTVSTSVAGGANQTLHMRVGINGTTDAAAEIIHKIGNAGDVASTALHLVRQLSTGDHISLWIRNATSTNNVTVDAANLQAITMPLAS